MKRQRKEPNNLRVAIVFCGFVFLLIAISLIIKLFSTIMNSKYDGKHNFNVILYTLDKSKEKEIISFSPDTQSVSILKVYTDKNQEEIAKILEIPIDGKIEIADKNLQIKLFQEDVKIEPTFKQIILNLGKVKTELTIIDFFRLWNSLRATPAHSIASSKITLSNFNGDLGQSFIDYSLANEKSSIQIINGTDVLGLGNRLAKLITNIGGNVVIVSSSDKPIAKSEILSSNKNLYTTKRIGKILKISNVKMTRGEISDIIIKIGEDSLSSLSF